MCEERLTAKQQRLQEAVQYISEDSALEQAVRTHSGSHLHHPGDYCNPRAGDRGGDWLAMLKP